MPDPLCPLCKQSNNCCTPSPTDCWCNNLDLSTVKKDLEQKLKEFAGGNTSSCICKNCLMQAGARSNDAIKS